MYRSAENLLLTATFDRIPVDMSRVRRVVSYVPVDTLICILCVCVCAYWATTGVLFIKILGHAQDSYACTALIVHAQHSCACTGGARAPRLLFVWVPALGPGPSSACTRVLCIHKSVVNAQKSCACTINIYFNVFVTFQLCYRYNYRSRESY